MRSITGFFCALIFATVALMAPAYAGQHHHLAAAKYLDPGCNVIFPCAPMVGQTVRGIGLFDGIKSINITMHRDRTTHHRSDVGRREKSSQYRYDGGGTSVASIVSHPTGCPSRAFCGCGAAVHIFGSPIRSLWLAANWFKFPRTSPAPGMAAVRSHHVFVLEQHLGGDTWMVFDANSGGHATRLHARSISGYAIVDPHA